MSDDPVLLRIEGAVDRPIGLTLADLEGMPEGSRVADVSRFQTGRRGDGVTLASLLDRAGPRAEATFVTLHSDRDNFRVAFPLAPLREQGVIVYKVGDEPLSVEHGGPIRLLLRSRVACKGGDLDESANVKFLSRIELTVGRPGSKP